MTTVILLYTNTYFIFTVNFKYYNYFQQNRKERKRVIHKGQAQPPFHLNAEFADQMADLRDNGKESFNICIIKI